MKKIIKKEKNMEDNLYHNTFLLLKQYRNVVWSVEVSMIRTKMKFQCEIGCSLEEFLEMTYAAGMDLSDSDLTEQIKNIERNRKMLEVIDNAVNLMREKNPDGEIFYWILYFQYLSIKPLKTNDEVMRKVIEKTGEEIAEKTFYRKRNAAIKNLSEVLWGFCTSNTKRKEVEALLLEYNLL